MKTAILGGGLTGLTLGYLMKQLSREFEVLEKENECGGLMRTLHENGFSFDYGGSHVIFSKNAETLSFMLSLLGNNKLTRERNTKVLYKACYVKYPFENGLADLPREETFECLSSFIQNLINKEIGQLKKPRTLKEWFYYTFGKGITEKYLLPYNKKIWKYPIENIGLDWVDRVPAPPIEDVIKSALDIKTEGYIHQLHFHYPKKDGIEALITALEAQMKKNILNNFEVKRLKQENGLWTVSNGKEEKHFDKIISTIPIHKLVTAINTPKKVKTAAKKLRYNSLITIMIGTNKSKINDLSWLYIPNKNILPHRVSFPSNFSPNVAPCGKSSLLAEITCTPRSKIWKMTDDEIIAKVIDDLQNAALLNKKDVCFARAKRSEYAYVINDLTYNENLRIVKNFLKTAGIDIIGRFGSFRYLNMDACIESALTYLRENELAPTKLPSKSLTTTKIELN